MGNDGGAPAEDQHRALQNRIERLGQRIHGRVAGSVATHAVNVQSRATTDAEELHRSARLRITERTAAVTAAMESDYQLLADAASHAQTALQQRDAQRLSTELQAKHREWQATLQAEIQAIQHDLMHRAEALRHNAHSSIHAQASTARAAIHAELEAVVSPLPQFRGLTLDRDTMWNFVHFGYIVLRQVVAQEFRDAALRVINVVLGEGFQKKELMDFRRPTAEVSAPILRLLTHTPALATAQALTGPTAPCWGGQLAIRFPGCLCIDVDLASEEPEFIAVPGVASSWHIDGFDKPNKLDSFSCLIGVYLNDLPHEQCGNLVVFPTGHSEVSDHFTRRLTTITAAKTEVGVTSWDSLHAGYLSTPSSAASSPEEMILRQGFRHGADIKLASKPHPVCVQAGDVVIAHYALPHSIAPNTSPNVRYAVYFRISSKAAEGRSLTGKVRALANIWEDFPPLKTAFGL